MTDVVIDLGCARYAHVGGGLDSTAILSERFRPTRLYGFDPLSDGDETAEEDTELSTSPTAAWIWDGNVNFSEDGVASSIHLEGRSVLPADMHHKPRQAHEIPCFDLAAWLRLLNEKVILKMDVEGAEYLLLTWLLATDAIGYVDLLLVEWHGHTTDRIKWRTQLRRELDETCPVEEWVF